MDCTGCPQAQPLPTPGNWLVWELYLQLAPLLRDGWGGINGPGIEAGLRMLGVPSPAWPELLKKLLILLSDKMAPEPGDEDGG